MNVILRNTEVRVQEFVRHSYEQPDIKPVELELLDALSDSRGEIHDMCMHILNAGGKRIRPLMVLYSGMAFSPHIPELIHAAAASELIHMASLVHDDIIDQSDLRRNKPSVNKRWDNRFAVLCGDYLFAKAFGILSANRLIRSMDFMVEAIGNMCHGEILQAADRYNCDTGIDAYYERITKKTAIFLACCCKSGAAAAGADEVQIELLGEYGLNIGLAYQIMDDMMDIFGDENKIGKPKNEDLPQGNLTLPLILLLKDAKYGTWLRENIGRRNFTKETNEEIISALNTAEVPDQCRDIMTSHIEKAKSLLYLLPDSPYKGNLLSITDMLKTRVS